MLKHTIAAAAAAAMLGAFGVTQAETTVGQKVDNAAHKTAQATRHAVHKTAKATRNAAHKTAQATRKAAHKVNVAAHKTAHKARMHTAVHRPTRAAPAEFHATTTREQRMHDARSNWERTRKL